MELLKGPDEPAWWDELFGAVEVAACNEDEDLTPEVEDGRAVDVDEPLMREED